MSITANLKVYANDTARSPDSYRYNGPVHSFASPDTLDLWRKAPIKTLTSAGKGRAMMKVTRGVTDGTTYTDDAILKIEVSFPANGATAELQAMLDDVASWLATASATDALISHEINQI